MRFPFLLGWLLSTCTLVAEDGLFADFSTSLGDFTCQLHFDLAPQTVANFITLTTGDRAWMDPRDGTVRTSPFYEGLRFHRVIPGFVIQAGSPRGDGSDGPGYTFRDEFHPTLAHHTAGILSMANSGPNSNGSQFFITLDPTPWLDGVHSIFGQITSGLSVAQAIGAVETHPNGQPLTPVLIHSVTLRRVGPAAEAFDPTSLDLPSVAYVPASLQPVGSSFNLDLPWQPASEYWLARTTNLTTWSPLRIGFYSQESRQSPINLSSLTTGVPRQFFRTIRTSYPPPLLTADDVSGKTLTLLLEENLAGEVIYVDFFADGSGGVVELAGDPPGAITGGSWSPQAYRAVLNLQSESVAPLSLSLVFTTELGGTVKGTGNQGAFPVVGTFTLVPFPEP